MKIEKKKITDGKPLSTATKSAIAAALGMAAAFTLNACDDTSSASSEEPLGGDVAPEETILPDSVNSSETVSSSSQEGTTPSSSTPTEGPASSSQGENTPSSSSKIVDFPLSQEPVSSSVAEAISSLMEMSSSEATPASSEAEPTSSDAAPTSSTVAPESSSAVAPPSSSSNYGWGVPNSSSVNLEEVCPDDDPWCIQVHMCENPSGCMAGSMVTTFERDDITG